MLVTAVPLIARAQPALLASGQFLVAAQEGVIVGAGGWSMQAPGGRPGARGVGHIRHVATDPDYLRRGVGRMLLQQVLFQARASGMMQMQCQSTLTAVPFYQAMGFVQQAEIEIALRPGIPFRAVFMVAQL
ncbi:GNAT family N-acetyltransferase [Aestuariicoccus sp. MJ-SS9]|uniref:GNAT family N-acetyltransferase n=1 Tax=Aestuariicoccus sp. MJ-SS9 TaxID=3079855 RepID=UPI0029110365|nr:GNAT family N-acetyltransferase [Aestuariicoccus sp. MJ-SS9]MDU8910268.1 GNAT family N-acetyltransferase [Aestuariicoccus sp. MJ-SS9]